MKRFILTYIFLSVVGIWSAMAQETLYDKYGNQIDPSSLPDNLEDTTNTEIVSLPPKLYMWKIGETLGNRNETPADTASLNFQSTNLVGGMYGHYNYLGNLGAPRLSRIFFERNADEPTMFLAPYSSFFVRPQDQYFTNSNIPYTNITYYKAGNKENGEEQFKTYFSVNVNKDFAFGFNVDYQYGRGYYQNQSTSHLNAGLFASYIGEKYEMHAIYNNFRMKMNENGGIADDQYITAPENMAEGKKEYESSTIPVNLEEASNRNSSFYIYLTHRYHLGFTRVAKRAKEKNEEGGTKPPEKPQQQERQRPPQQQGMPPGEGGMPPGQGEAPPPQQQGEMPPKPEGMPGNGGPFEKTLSDITASADSLSHLALAGNDSIALAGNDSIALASQTLPSVAKDDSITIEEFIPVTSFIHTMKVERSRHRFRTEDEPSGFFPEEYTLYEDCSNDTTTAFSVKNLFGISLLEGFNKYAKAGLTAYISHKYSQFNLMNPDTASTSNKKYTEQEIYVGGELSKREGNLLHYNVNGEVGIFDKAAGQFRINADLDMNFRLWKDTVNFYARGYISNTLPSFYMRHYHSNHYNWDEDLDKEFRTRVEAEIDIPRWRTNLRFGVENIKNYTFLNQDARPEQAGDNIQVLSATFRQDFKVGVFHLDNEVTWQKSGDEDILPLPQLSLYHNFYILGKLSKGVLTVQLGADVRYFSEYKAPAYAPGIQQYHLQPTDDQIDIGGFPVVNAYINFHLKRTRFFVMMYHVNKGMGDSKYFLVPHYPINQRVLKFGLSWNFYD